MASSLLKLGFDVERTLGEGGFGCVVLVSNPLRAIKVIERGDAQAEVSFMKKLQHRNIVQFYDSFCLEATTAIVMEYAANGNVMMELERSTKAGLWLEEAAVLRWISEEVTAVGYMHGLGILHRDIKNENFLIAGDGRLLLTDFGASIQLGTAQEVIEGAHIGTLLYMAPEICGKKVAKYSIASDMWALGCSFFEMMSGGSPPYLTADESKLRVVICTEKLVDADGPFAPEMKDLCRDMLSRKPAKRPHTEAVLHSLPRSAPDWSSFFPQVEVKQHDWGWFFPTVEEEAIQKSSCGFGNITEHVRKAMISWIGDVASKTLPSG
ncbi:Nek3 [Symbiodinium natans]|uniref:Nek3 protein n=1 Tax=Symbiodinium natans TaxID=878477 RepID=A0A812T4G1_9DINO|nr:Nek3 [Symbiodinium natans]